MANFLIGKVEARFTQFCNILKIMSGDSFVEIVSFFLRFMLKTSRFWVCLSFINVVKYFSIKLAKSRELNNLWANYVVCFQGKLSKPKNPIKSIFSDNALSQKMNRVKIKWISVKINCKIGMRFFRNVGGIVFLSEQAF